jgi:hypothetical protein
MWVGPPHQAGGERRQEVGGRFVGLSPALRLRIGAILSFDEARPALRLVRIERPPVEKASGRRSAARRRA